MHIDIDLSRKEIVNDVIVQCNTIGRALARNTETEELASDIMTPDDDQTKPTVARALTEAFGEVKRTCQRYLLYGRYTDDNRLERIDESSRYEESLEAGNLTTDCKYHLLTGIKYRISTTADMDTDIKIMDNEGTVLARGGRNITLDYTPVRMDEYLTITARVTVNITVNYSWGDFGTYELRLEMPANFNIGMTETIKTCAHRMMTDYVMAAVLQNQLAEKANEYASRFTNDQEALKKALIARNGYRRPTAADWS